MDPSEQPRTGAGQRRKHRRLRSWWRHEQQSIAAALATSLHHSSRGQRKARAGEEESELNYTATVRKTPPSQPVFFSLKSPADGGLPAWQSRRGRRSGSSGAPWSSLPKLLPGADPRRSCTADCGPAGGSSQALRHHGACAGDRRAQEHFHRCHPAARCAPRAADGRAVGGEPVPSFDDFELVRDAPGRSWCRVAGPAGVYWWMIGTSTAQNTHPEGITARPGRYTNTGHRGGSGG